MTQQERNKQTLSNALEAQRRGDAAAYREFFHPEVKWTIIGSTPMSKAFQSRDELFFNMAEVLGDVLAEPLRIELIEAIAEGNHVAARLTAQAKAKNGTDYHQVYCWWLQIESDKVVEAIAYMDTSLVDRVLS